MQRADLWYPSSRVQTRPKPSDFYGRKTPAFEGEVKPSVACRRFAACKRSPFQQDYRTTFPPTVPPYAARISRVVAAVEAPGDENGNV